MEADEKYREEDFNQAEDCGSNEDASEKNYDIKEEVLDLTVHCEPTLIEEEDESYGENNYSESFALGEECPVDPLEFLEVDQNSLTESIEDEFVVITRKNSPKESKKSEEDDEAAEVDIQAPGLENDKLKRQTRRGTNKEVVLGDTPLGYIVCQDCGYLKSSTKSCDEPEIFKKEDTEPQSVCGCDKDKVRCKTCKKLVKLSSYDCHIQRHRVSRKYKCETCGKMFIHPSHLQSHAYTHEKRKTNFCSICKRSFKLLKSLRHHQIACKSKKFYKCNDCEQSFPLKRSLFNHLRTHKKVDEESFNCEICCIVFDNSSSKKEHIMQVHVAAQRFVCGSCGEAFVTECEMKRHTAAHGRRYCCRLCGAAFSKRRDLVDHRASHRTTVGQLQCDTCGRGFDQPAAYTKHKLAQSCSGDQWACDQCGKLFKDKYALKKHTITHVPISERSVSCDICNRNFSGMPALRKHMRLIHANTRPYTCEFCSKSFNQLCKLKYHIVIHSSDKPVSCDICQKAFSNEKDIKIHMRTHTGEKPYKCDECGKSFRQRGHVKTHQLVHTKEKPFNCPYCEKSFGLTSSLKKHIKLHTSNISITNR